MMNALSAQGAAAQRQDKGNGRGKGKGKGKGASQKEKFMWKSGKCWDCGDENHTRPDCPHWKSIIDSNGKPPNGYKGMKDKAYAAFKEKRDKARSHLKALGYEPNTEDEDEEDVEPDSMVLCLGSITPQPLCHRLRLPTPSLGLI